MKTLILPVAFATLLMTTVPSMQTTSPFVIAKCDGEAPMFSNVHVPEAVLADGKLLAAGDYQVRITTEHPAPAVGQSPSAECWVEFVKGSAVAGREVASVISAQDIGTVVTGPGPKPNAVQVDLLKGAEYLRVWMNGSGAHYIVNMPVVR